MAKKMAKRLVIPTLACEADDAAWHESHKQQLEAEMARRIGRGAALTLNQAMARNKARSPLRPVTIRLPLEDIDAARELAAQKGIGYQTYIRILLREGLDRRTGREADSRRK